MAYRSSLRIPLARVVGNGVARQAGPTGGNGGAFSGRKTCPCLCFSGLFCIISIL